MGEGGGGEVNWMLDSGCWILEVVYRVDVRFWILDEWTGGWMLDFWKVILED